MFVRKVSLASGEPKSQWDHHWLAIDFCAENVRFSGFDGTLRGVRFFDVKADTKQGVRFPTYKGKTPPKVDTDGPLTGGPFLVGLYRGECTW